MLFLAMILAVTILALAAQLLLRRAPADLPQAMRIGLAAGLVFFGVDHLLTPERYLPMIESFLPWPGGIVLFTGLCEIAGAFGLLVPRLRRTAAILLALYFVAVLPANINNALQAMEGLGVQGLPASPAYYWSRLLFQPVYIWWALAAGGVVRLPWSRKPA